MRAKAEPSWLSRLSPTSNGRLRSLRSSWARRAMEKHETPLPSQEVPLQDHLLHSRRRVSGGRACPPST